MKLHKSKSKQKIVNKSSRSEKAKVNCGKIHSDILTIKPKHGQGTILKNNSHIIVDESTGYRVLNFVKPEVVQWSMCSIEKCQQADKPVKAVQRDNAQENKKLQTQSNQAAQMLNIQF